MFLKDKLYLIAGNVDDSIKSSAAVYDVTIFKSFIDFENYVDTVPIIIDTLVISARELQFTNTNMTRLLNILNAPFVTVKSSIIYLVDSSYNLDIINKFLNDKKLSNWSVYQGDLSPKFISEILSGERRNTVEGQIDLVTYRMRTEEYIRQQQLKKEELDSDVYLTDEDILSGIPDEEPPVAIVPEGSTEVSVSYIVGADIIERTLLTFIVAQYRALSGKTLLVEKDVEYHRLSDMVTKADVSCELLDIEELMKDSMGVIGKIKLSNSKLIVLTCQNRIQYDYNFLMDILESMLMENLMYIVRECNFEEAPFGKPYTIVMRNTIPDILKSCNSLRYDIFPKEVVFVGMMLGNLGPVNVSSEEMNAVISQVLEKNDITTTIVKAEGVRLKGEGLNYDILSIISGEYRR